MYGLRIKFLTLHPRFCGHSSVGRALASQAESREFESRCPLFFAVSGVCTKKPPRLTEVAFLYYMCYIKYLENTVILDKEATSITRI